MMQIDILTGKAMPPFAALRAFEVVGRTGGVRKAATMLRLDPTVVSRHLRTLEDWLGVRLFDRDGNRLMLTDHGQTYHRRISSAILDVVAATRDIRAHDHTDRLQIWCVPGFGAQWLADHLAGFEAAHPQWQVEMRPTDTMADLAQLEADIDIRYYGDHWLPHPQGPGLRSVELARPPLKVVASPALAAQWGHLATPADLLAAPLLHEEHDQQWRAWLALNGVQVPDKLPGPLLWHAHLALAAARQGRGLALASDFLVARDLDRGDLVEIVIPGSHRAVIGSYHLVARADRWANPAIARLRHYLIHSAQQFEHRREMVVEPA